MTEDAHTAAWPLLITGTLIYCLGVLSALLFAGLWWIWRRARD